MSKTFLKKNIIFTGGGSGGHVIPALTLMAKLKDQFHIVYIGSILGIERKLVEQQGFEYYPIPTGKLRRYFSFQNILDQIHIVKGICKSFFFLYKFNRQTLIFSMGGYVSLPVIIAAWPLRRTIYLHEQTSQAGLANRMASLFATKIFVSFHESQSFFPKKKTVFSGHPLKDECYENTLSLQKIAGIKFTSQERPIVFISGGGNGSALLNEKVRKELNELKKIYTVFHQVGRPFFEEYKKLETSTYRVFAFLESGIIDLFKRADIVLSRAGAGTVCELMVIGKRSIFVPLKIAQKNEQFHNAGQAKALLGSLIIEEDDFKNLRLVDVFASFLQESIEPQNFKENPYRKIRGTDVLVQEIKQHYYDSNH